MSIEPNLRSFESNWNGVPYGYGTVPVPPVSRPPGDTLNAVSRPQPIRNKDRDSGRSGRRKRNWLKAETFSELWKMLGDWWGELPGFFEALAGLLAAPFKLLGWLFSKPFVRGFSLTGLIVAGLMFLALPLISTSHHDCRRCEGDQLMGSARDHFRMQFAKTDDFEAAVEALSVKVDQREFEGEYYGIEARVVKVTSSKARVYVYPQKPGDRFGYMEFDLKTGESFIRWDDYRRRR